MFPIKGVLIMDFTSEDILVLGGLGVLIVICITAVIIGSWYHVKKAKFTPTFIELENGNLQMEFYEFGGIQTSRTKRFHETYKVGSVYPVQGRILCHFRNKRNPLHQCRGGRHKNGGISGQDIKNRCAGNKNSVKKSNCDTFLYTVFYCPHLTPFPAPEPYAETYCQQKGKPAPVRRPEAAPCPVRKSRHRYISI